MVEIIIIIIIFIMEQFYIYAVYAIYFSVLNIILIIFSFFLSLPFIIVCKVQEKNIIRYTLEHIIKIFQMNSTVSF